MPRQLPHLPAHDQITTSFYLLSGFNRLTGLKERWIGPTPSAGPPSGAALSDIEVEGFWQTQS